MDRPPFDFSGGALCLDWANTVGDRESARNERLGGLDDVLRWAAEAGILGPADRARLTREAGRRPRLAAAAFRRAVALRERIYRIFAAVAAGSAPSRDDLDGFNSELATALGQVRIAPAGEGFGWAWAPPGAGFDWVLRPVARSAGELLTSDEVRRVRECDSGECTWLFLDRSRAGRRRWCDMKVCGNRAKARRHYRRSLTGR